MAERSRVLLVDDTDLASIRMMIDDRDFDVVGTATSGQEAKINLVTVDTEGAVRPYQKVVVGVYDRTWVTTKEQTPDGARQYRSDPVDKRRMIERVLTSCEDHPSAEIEPLLMLLRRFATEAAREEARLFCDELAAA